jgi:predicted Zn-dependent protease
VRILIALLLVLSVVACETVPITGRSQLVLIPEGTEVQMGLDSYQQILSKAKVSNDPRGVEQVTRVGRRIAAATERSDYQWEFTVIEDAQVNAFCLRMSQQLAVQGVTLAGAQALLAGSDPRFVQLAAAALGGVATVGVLLPFSRAQESEADHLGLIYMAKAGYHPTAARDLWKRMAERSGGGGQSESSLAAFLSTHPLPATRITQIEGWIPEALKHYKPR